jgi:hypothetical protein
MSTPGTSMMPSFCWFSNDAWKFVLPCRRASET